jgi:type II secretion system protein C
VARELLGVLVLVVALASRASADPALPETQLPLRLIGTVVASQVERSIAVIENSGATFVVRTGDAIVGARVQEIRKDGVVLALAGRLERLAFASALAAASAGSRPTSVSASARAEGDASALEARDGDFPQAQTSQRARAAARARAARATAVPASAAAQDGEGETGSEVTQAVSAEQLLLSLSSQARYAPLLDEGGKLRGVALMDIRPDSTLERLGLRSGDVVVSVAGVKVDNSSQAFDALRALDPRAGGEVLVERGGVPTRIAVPAGTL